jgi:hypothetical protein
VNVWQAPVVGLQMVDVLLAFKPPMVTVTLAGVAA